MPNRPNSHTLRQLAENVVRQFIGEGETWRQDQADLATSLVRQWITYDGNATLFQAEQQFYFVLGHTPLGKGCLNTAPVLGDGMSLLVQKWKIEAESLPDVIDQLNRGQSAEVTNADGLPVRLWVNPKEKRIGIEPLVKQPLAPGWKRDHFRLASNVLEDHLGASLDPAEKEELACSLARQWQRYQGHACLFLGAEQLAFSFTEGEEGACDISIRHSRANLEPLLRSHGLPPEDIPEAIARINLDQEVEFQDNKGVRCRLWHDPRTSRLHARPIEPIETAPPAVQHSTPPLFCPKCSAVLRLWQAGERQQVCPCCAHTISLPG